MTAFRRDENAGYCREVPAFAARSPAAVETDVKAAPVIHGRDTPGRRFWVRTRGEIGSRGGRSQPERNETNGTQQKLLHRISPALVRFVWSRSDANPRTTAAAIY